MEGRCFTSKAFCLLWAFWATGPWFPLLICWSGDEQLSPCSQEELGKYWRQKWIEKIISESELHTRSQWRNIPTTDRIRPSLATGRDKTAGDAAGITPRQNKDGLQTQWALWHLQLLCSPLSKGKGCYFTGDGLQHPLQGTYTTCHVLLSGATSFPVPSRAPQLEETKSTLVFLLRDELSWHKMKPFV